MSYLVLARKWRPQRFADVIGQRHVALTLTSALSGDRLSHAYLFTGPRGVGKTSMARILAKALNCERGPAAEPCNECAACRSITEGHCLDVLEIDGASNRGIDDVRQLRESVKYAPASVRAKVYIIDEVHMLTTDAFNALLKTLEEPPAHVYFVLATTEPVKLPATILSRCQRHDFGRLTVADLVENLRRIVTAEGIEIEDEALRLIGRKAEGSVRDTLTLLDQVAASGRGPFVAAGVREILGLAGSALYFEISAAVIAGDARAALLAVERAYRDGLNLQELADELVGHFRNILLLSMDAELADAIEATPEEGEELKQQAARSRPADGLRWLRILLDIGPRMRRSPHGRVHLEVALAEMAALPKAVELARVLERLQSQGCEGPEGPSRPERGNPPAGRASPEPRGGRDRPGS
ncbi:MAG: DNA polymerase III subunit gamma/tau, partial [Candidatus Eisenbacteria bacterium]